MSALVVLVAGASACGGSISGRLGAEEFGDLTNPPAERTDGRLAIVQACGVGAAAAAPYSFARTPYLQRVTAEAAEISWVGAPEPGPSVSVSSADGTIVAQAAAAADMTAKVGAGTLQLVAPLGSLAPSTIYCYDVQDGTSASDRLGFRTAPAAGTGAPVRFIAFGDSGSGTDDQMALRDQMATVPFDFMIHTGDIAYGSGTRQQLQDYFFTPYAEYLRYFPVFPASGNHEYETEGAAPFREAFVLPENGGPDGIERWYSFDWGDVHFVALDTERMGAVQAAWLDADLTANQRPWTIVYGHRPPFSSGGHGSDGNFRAHFLPILEKHQVPLVLNGHDHHYERTTPQNGVTYVGTGGGGRGVAGAGRSTFTAFSHPVIHFVYVTISGPELALHAIDGLGQEFDSLVIRRPRLPGG